MPEVAVHPSTEIGVMKRYRYQTREVPSLLMHTYEHCGPITDLQLSLCVSILCSQGLSDRPCGGEGGARSDAGKAER